MQTRMQTRTTNLKHKNQNICVVQFDDRSPLPYALKKLMLMNRDHCKRNNIHYHLFHGNSNFPPYWNKVKLILKLLTEESYDIVIWLDSDALINTRTDVGTFVATHMSDKHMLISNDMSPWSHGAFNAGVWAVKNSAEGRLIMTEWFSLYDPMKWKKHKNVWHTVSEDEYAGESYEQGSFVTNILPKYNNFIHKVNYKLINNPFYSSNSNVIHHFAGVHMDKVLYLL